MRKLFKSQWIVISLLAFPTLVFSFTIETVQNTQAKNNGELCKRIGGDNSQCNSGYCLPAPARKCSSNVDLGYCTHQKYNCAKPDEIGGMYGETIKIGKEILTCQNPGKGRWAQFCSIK